MTPGSEFPETLRPYFGGKVQDPEQPLTQGKCQDEEGQLRCPLRPDSLGPWLELALAHPEELGMLWSGEHRQTLQCGFPGSTVNSHPRWRPRKQQSRWGSNWQQAALAEQALAPS